MITIYMGTVFLMAKSTETILCIHVYRKVNKYDSQLLNSK